MSNFIKLKMLLPKEETGQAEDAIIESWIDTDRIVVMQDTSVVEQKYKSFVIMDGVPEGMRFEETVEYIVARCMRN